MAAKAAPGIGSRQIDLIVAPQQISAEGHKPHRARISAGGLSAGLGRRRALQRLYCLFVIEVQSRYVRGRRQRDHWNAGLYVQGRRRFSG
jgi:hypothetical protein